MPNHLPKGGAAVQSRITHFKPGIGTLAPGGIPLFGRRPIGPLARRAKRGEGRFCQSCLFYFETVNNAAIFSDTADEVKYPAAAAGPEGLWPGGSSGALFLTG